MEGIDYGLCVRRIALDAALVETATAAGADVRFRTRVEGLIRSEDRVVGVVARSRGGGPYEIRARLVVGADGHTSTVARLVGAAGRTPRTATSGPSPARPPASPGRPAACPAAPRTSPIVGATELPSYFRRSSGPGWALAGDAGHFKDPITAQGIRHALRFGRLLGEMTAGSLDDPGSLDQAVPAWEQRRRARSSRPT